MKHDSHLLASLFSRRSFCRQPLSAPAQSHQPALLPRLLKDLTVPYHITPIPLPYKFLPLLQVSASCVVEKVIVLVRELVNCFLIVSGLIPKIIILFLDYLKNLATVKLSEVGCTQVSFLVRLTVQSQRRAENSP